MGKEPKNERHEQNTKLKREWDRAGAALVDAREHGDQIRARRMQRRQHTIGTQFVELNYGLAVAAARPFAHKNNPNVEDYRSAALQGLWEAFLLWDPTVSTFGTFSRTHMMGRVNRAVSRAEAHTISYSDFTARKRVRQARDQLQAQGTLVTVERLAVLSGETEGVVHRTLHSAQLYLDAPFRGQSSDGDASTLSDVLADELDADDGDSGVDLDRVLHAIQDRAAALSPAELFVLVRRSGLDGAAPQTLEEITDLCGIGRETARRIDQQAVTQLTAGLVP